MQQRRATFSLGEFRRGGGPLPAALGEPMRLRDVLHVDSDHCLTQSARHLGQHVRVVHRLAQELHHRIERFKRMVQQAIVASGKEGLVKQCPWDLDN